MERDVIGRIRAVVAAMPGVRVWRNQVGEIHEPKRHLKYGLGLGSADIIGLVTMPSGMARFLAIEVKDKGVVSPEQRAWLGCVNRDGGAAAVIRNEQDAMAFVRRAQQGERFAGMGPYEVRASDRPATP